MCRVPAAVCAAVRRRVALCAMCRPPCAPPCAAVRRRVAHSVPCETPCGA
eukprot:gene12192-biopygen8498